MVQYITKEGLENLKKDLDELKEKRVEITKRVEEAKSLGDLSENAEYMSAREAQSFNEGRIIEVENLIKEAQIIESIGTDYVQVGSSIVVSSDGKEQAFIIVGSQEADPERGLISNESPLGKAFLGHRRDDTVEIKVPTKVVKYKIIKIS